MDFIRWKLDFENDASIINSEKSLALFGLISRLGSYYIAESLLFLLQMTQIKMVF